MNSSNLTKSIFFGTLAGGHHREGVLSFSRLTSAPKSIELKITGIADTIRTFTWQLDK
ncbi:MAG: hypothetical protein UY69_C0008G0017 [Parcubacteria group bacterium GW2011_GWF1_52_5]|nr:MAG: hypothetical protein UY69_C0008G0017 [Parcubacteria group bacterium GW2011_GWF1_52_5]